MANGINKAFIVGNLGQDPDIRYSTSGDPVANLSIATSESWKDKNGEQQQRTEWHRVVLFKKQAEIAGQYLKKGSKIYVEGQIRTRKWQDQSGADRYTTEIVAREMQMLSPAPEGAPAAPSPQAAPYQQAASRQQQPEIHQDDIPF